MTIEEIHSQLKLVSKEDLLKFKTDLESDSTQFIKTYNDPSNALHVLGHAIIEALRNSRSNFRIPDWNTKRTYFFYDNGTSGIPRCDSVISNSLRIEIWPYLPKPIKDTNLYRNILSKEIDAYRSLNYKLDSLIRFKEELKEEIKSIEEAIKELQWL